MSFVLEGLTRPWKDGAICPRLDGNYEPINNYGILRKKLLGERKLSYNLSEDVFRIELSAEYGPN
jgi:hypothetical protein